MSARLLEGEPIAAAIRAEVTERAARFRERTGRPPGLAVLLVGDDAASRVYVGKKEAAASAAGLSSRSIRLAAETPEDEIVAHVQQLVDDDATDGILVQLPLPRHVDSIRVIETIAPSKDVDGFHPASVGRLHLGIPSCQPCTPAGVMRALRHHGVETEGRSAVVIGRSQIVGKPMAALLLAADATVTICHSRTRDLAEVCRRADILVAATGRAAMVGAEFIKPGATVIDVGINRLTRPKDDALAARALGEGSKRHARYLSKGEALVGDVHFLEASEVAGLITPVPGGVGPLTIAMLLSNTVDAAERRVMTEARD